LLILPAGFILYPMKILLVCYYFPPMGMGGVQRPAKFAKYLSRLGHEVTVIAAQPSPGEITDDSLLTDLPEDVRVTRVRVRHPRNLLRWLPGRGKVSVAENRGVGRLRRQLAAWSRVPDDKIGFIPGAIAAAKEAFAAKPPDVVMTSSPPPSIHIIGRRLQKMWRTCWVADFRDPWFMAVDERLPTPVHRAIRSKVLGTTLSHADGVVTVSPGIVDDFRRWGFDRPDIEVITNGYDEDDFKSQDESDSILPPERFRFHMYGTISPQAPPDPFFRALSVWLKKNPEQADKIEVSHRGAIIGIHLDDLFQKYDLPKRFASLGYAPHWFAVKELMNVNALVISVADRPGLKSNIPGRVYECLRSGRPILAFVPPDGAAADILRQFDGVWVMDPKERESGIRAIDRLFRQCATDLQAEEYLRENITVYSRKVLTDRLAEAFILAMSK